MWLTTYTVHSYTHTLLGTLSQGAGYVLLYVYRPCVCVWAHKLFTWQLTPSRCGTAMCGEGACECVWVHALPSQQMRHWHPHVQVTQNDWRVTDYEETVLLSCFSAGSASLSSSIWYLCCCQMQHWPVVVGGEGEGSSSKRGLAVGRRAFPEGAPRGSETLRIQPACRRTGGPTRVCALIRVPQLSRFLLSLNSPSHPTSHSLSCYSSSGLPASWCTQKNKIVVSFRGGQGGERAQRPCKSGSSHYGG